MVNEGVCFHNEINLVLIKNTVNLLKIKYLLSDLIFVSSASIGSVHIVY